VEKIVDEKYNYFKYMPKKIVPTSTTTYYNFYIPEGSVKTKF
jgi:hypothetical protein